MALTKSGVRPGGAWCRRVLAVLLAACALAGAGTSAAQRDAPASTVARRAMAEIGKHYKDPVIGQRECPFPGLLVFTAFERANLNEDPLVPDQWFALADSPAVKTLPLARIRCQPKDTQEAVALATWLFSTEYPWSLIKTTRVEQDRNTGRIQVTFQAEIGLAHPMFHQGRRPGKAVVIVENGCWSMQVDDPFIEPADSTP